MLCVPVFNSEGQIVAVIQAVNKRADYSALSAASFALSSDHLSASPPYSATSASAVSSPAGSPAVLLRRTSTTGLSSSAKVDLVFTKQDQTLLEIFGLLVGHTLQHAILFEVCT
jgi:GAF domain-containing protein